MIAHHQLWLLGVLAVVAGSATAQGKPHATPAPTVVSSGGKTAVDGAESSADAPLAHWLLQQDGGPGALVLPLGKIIQAATGASVGAVDRSDAKEAAFIKVIGSVLDGILPQMNKPDSPAHNATGTDQVALVFANTLAAKFIDTPDVAIAIPKVSGHGVGAAYPNFVASSALTGRDYYFGVSIFAAAERTAATNALRVRSTELAPFSPQSGCACLLVAIETNGKTGKEAAFLNWELIDVAKLPVRATMTFEGTQEAVHAPGVMLDDGRKGRD